MGTSQTTDNFPCSQTSQVCILYIISTNSPDELLMECVWHALGAFPSGACTANVKDRAVLILYLSLSFLITPTMQVIASFPPKLHIPV